MKMSSLSLCGAVTVGEVGYRSGIESFHYGVYGWIMLMKTGDLYKDLQAERDGLSVEWAKLIEENKYFAGEVYNDHVNDFYKGIMQCDYFFDVLNDHEGYDIMKMVVDGQLVDLPLPHVKAEEVLSIVSEEPQLIEVVVEDVEDEGHDRDE
ncbi:hypothetical protein LR48_Vigan08g007200 [Vigna angularis]|uniref:Uncharacterized protein n=1 Tax=Phaseolus angularis TaxID=3914 RepID=A0A0L9V291_PHAAN|nr:hypothetical protein LR48_Vigan08g007200 [Vigna angularis]